MNTEDKLDGLRDQLVTLRRDKRISEALSLCDNQLSKVGDELRHQIYGFRAMIWKDSGRFEFAINDLLRAHQLKPDHAGHCYNLGLIYLDHGEFDDVIKFANHLLAIEKKRNSIAFVEEALFFLGRAYIGLGDRQSAQHFASMLPDGAKTWQGRHISKSDLMKEIDALR